jgi:hypothetical protein
MATYKRIDGDYNITTLGTDDNVLITTHTVIIDGNLAVEGNVTYIETTDLIVDDPFILIAANNTGSGNSALFPEQGVVTQTGGSSFAGIRFNNPTGTWQVSASVAANGAPITAYEDLALASNAALPGGNILDIQYNATGNTFGGSDTYTFDAGNVRVTLQGHQIFGNIATAPTAVANSVALYHNALGSGGTGLYVKSPAVEDELVSKTKAIVFGIIF